MDLIDPKKRKKLHEIRVFETFGESKALQKPGYEHFGDLYAGLKPCNPLKDDNEAAKKLCSGGNCHAETNY